MKQKFQHFLQQSHLYVLLLPVFFTLHGFTEFYNLVPVKDTLRLLGFYLLLALLLLLPGLLLFRNRGKASLLTFFLLSVEFFYGAATDFIRHLLPGSFLGKNLFILPLLFVLLITVILLLRRQQKPLTRLSFFLSIACLLLIGIDTVTLLWRSADVKSTSSHSDTKFTLCPECKKPDIYLIIADGYPGQLSLEANFNYSNESFVTALRNRGFSVIDSSRSNYNFTPFSVSSMLNMQYLQGIKGVNSNLDDMRICYSTIKNSAVLQYLTRAGYLLYNYSIFDYNDNPSLTKAGFLPAKTSLITRQTFSERIMHEIGFHLVTTMNISYFTRKIRETDLVNNNLLIRKTNEIIPEKTDRPKFVYTHLVMPHYPYYFDSTGNRNSFDKLDDAFIRNKDAFISYLKYTNKELLKLVDHIKQQSPTPPVIMLMSDHGFREFSDSVAAPYHFYNLNALYMPDSNYTGRYNGMTNINQFRVFFNNQFSQQLPLLKDSCSLLHD